MPIAKASIISNAASLSISSFLTDALFYILLFYIILKVWGFEYIYDLFVNHIFDTKNNLLEDVREISKYLIKNDQSILIKYPILNYPNYLPKIDDDNHQSSTITSFCWFEALNSQFVQSFIKKQRNLYTIMAKQKAYSYIKNKILHKYEKHFGLGMKIVFAPFQKGQFYFYYKKNLCESSIDTLQQASLFYTKNIEVEGKVVLDCSKLLIDDGLILRGTWISNDGFKVAYGISLINSPFMTIYVRDLLLGDDSLIDVIHGCHAEYSSLSWLEGHLGFFYVKYFDYVNEEYKLGISKIMFHRLETSQIEDIVVYEDSRDLEFYNEFKLSDGLSSVIYENFPFKIYKPNVTPDEQYLVIEEFDLGQVIQTPISQQNLCDLLGSPCLGNTVHCCNLSLFDGHRAETLGNQVTLIESFDYRFEYVCNIEDKFWFKTNYLALGCRIVQLNLPKSILNDREVSTEETLSPNSKSMKYYKSLSKLIEFIAEHRDGGVLLAASIADQSIIVLHYLVNSSHEVLLYDLVLDEDEVSGSSLPLSRPLAILPHPQYGAITAIHCSYYSPSIFYEFNSLCDPTVVYRTIIKRSSPEKLRNSDISASSKSNVELSFDQLCFSQVDGINLVNGFEIIQHFIYTDERNEAIQVPLHLFRRRSEESDVAIAKPCIIWVYGGFGVSTLPTFSEIFSLFADSFDGIICILSIQGGGECGRPWHSRGHKINKHRSVNDLIKAARFLIEENYTTPSQLSLYGVSHGGLIVTRAALKQPHLFSCVIVENGYLDLLGHHLHPSKYLTDSNEEPKTTIGNSKNDKEWILENDLIQEINAQFIEEIGDYRTSIDELQRLSSVSPLHNISELFNVTSTELDNDLGLLVSTSRSSTVTTASSVKKISGINFNRKKYPPAFLFCVGKS